MVVQSQFIEMFRTAPKEHVHLKDIATYSIGLTYKPENVKPSGIPVLRSGNIQEESLDFGDLVRVDSSIPDTLLLQDGDILMCSRNGSAHLVGKVARIRQLPEPMTYGAFMTVIRSEYMDYLFLFFQSDGFRQQISYGKSSTMNQITQKMLDQITLDLPSNTEIKKLSPLLEQADKSKFDGLKSQFIEMFGDYHSNPKGWPVTSFEGFAKIDANMTTDYTKYADYPHIGVDSIEKGTGILSGYRTVKEDNVISGKYVFTPKHIIYSKIRPNLNKVALPEFDGVCSADAYPILPKEGICNRLYLAYLMRSNHFLEYILKFSARSSMPKVNREQINGYQAPLPPFKLQEDFSSIVQQADKSKFELKQAIEKIDKVMRALMQ